MKAILVIDFPKEYDVSDLRMVYIVGDSEGNVVKVQRELIPCLKPMPQKMEYEGDLDYAYGYIDGRNELIDEILGETE